MMTAKLSGRSTIVLDMVVFQDGEKSPAFNWPEHSKDRVVGRAIVLCAP